MAKQPFKYGGLTGYKNGLIGYKKGLIGYVFQRSLHSE
jgi:hypothetical protein